MSAEKFWENNLFLSSSVQLHMPESRTELPLLLLYLSCHPSLYALHPTHLKSRSNLNQIAYIAGRNTSVIRVLPNVPPIRV
ncbi:hypothetical protein AL522_22595 (plasmid) [Pantoea vagans]|nr:hypothetical protein AL522_22595 [Pantoea vagans]